MKVVCSACGRLVPVVVEADEQSGVTVLCACGALLVDDGTLVSADSVPHTPRLAFTPRSNQWLVRFADAVRPLTIDELIEEYRAGRIDLHTAAWKPGMARWYPLLEIPHLRLALQGDLDSREDSELSALRKFRSTGVTRARSNEGASDGEEANVSRSTVLPSAAAAEARDGEAEPILAKGPLAEALRQVALRVRNSAELSGHGLAAAHGASLTNPEARTSSLPPVLDANKAGGGDEDTPRWSSIPPVLATPELALRSSELESRRVEPELATERPYRSAIVKRRRSQPPSLPSQAAMSAIKQGQTAPVYHEIDAQLVDSASNATKPRPQGAANKRAQYSTFVGLGMAAALLTVALSSAWRPSTTAREASDKRESVQLQLRSEPPGVSAEVAESAASAVAQGEQTANDSAHSSAAGAGAAGEARATAPSAAAAGSRPTTGGALNRIFPTETPPAQRLVRQLPTAEGSAAVRGSAAQKPAAPRRDETQRAKGDSVAAPAAPRATGEKRKPALAPMPEF